MTNLELDEVVCSYCPQRFNCTINPFLCADCQDYIRAIRDSKNNCEEHNVNFQRK